MAYITESLTLITERCCNCGVVFAIPDYMQNRLRDDHTNFYCPNGHGQHYAGKTEADKLRDELKRKEQELATTVRQKLEAQNDLSKIKKRIKAGVCPCCNRTFKFLSAHMKNKHPKL